MNKKFIVISFLLVIILSIFVVANPDRKDFEQIKEYKKGEYKYSLHSDDIILFSKSTQHCSIKPDDINDGYKQCNPVISIWNNGSKNFNINSNKNLFSININKELKSGNKQMSWGKNKKDLLVSTNYEWYNKTKINKTTGKKYNVSKIKYTNWHKLKGNSNNIKSGEILGIKLDFEIPQYENAQYNISSSLGFLLDPDISSCGTLNTQGAEYTLTQDIMEVTTTCMIIDADDITLNLDRNMIDGTQEFETYGIEASNQSGITINGGGSIRQFSTGVNLKNISNSVVSYNDIIDHSSNGVTLDSNCNNINITSINASNNDNTGLSLSGDSHIVKDSETNYNSQNGLANSRFASTGITIKNHESISNGYGIRIMNGDSSVIDSIVKKNNDAGIYIYNALNTFYNNIFNNSKNIEFGSTDSNEWNNSLKGNYWYNSSNFGSGFSSICSDTNNNEICDNSYDIINNQVGCSSNNCDYLPQLENSPPNKPTNPNPNEGVTDISVTTDLSVDVIDDEDNIMNVSFYWSNDTLIEKIKNINSGNTATTSNLDLNGETTYNWYAVVDDGEFTNTSDTWSFTTEDITPPTITAPADDSITYGTDWSGADFDADESVTWSINDTTNFNINSTGYLDDNPTLSGGTYKVNVTATDTSGNSNSTIYTLTVNKATTSLSLSASPSWTETYGTETDISGSNCPSQLTCNLYRNNKDVSNSDINILSAGDYNYEYNTTGNENYTSDSVTNILTINKATPTASLTNSRTWSFTYDGNSATISYDESNTGDDDVNYIIWKDNSNKGTSDSEATAGSYSYKINTTGGTNYSATDNMDTNILSISKATPILSLASTNSTYPNNISIQTSESNTGDSNVNYNLYINNSYLKSGSNLDISKRFAAGNYTIEYNTTGGTNYTSNSITKPLEVLKGDVNIDIIFIQDTIIKTNENMTIELGDSFTGKAKINITKTEQVTDTLFNFYKNNNEVGSLSSDTILYENNSLPVGTYYFNSTWNGNENYTSTIRDPTLTVEDTTSPTINIKRPNNGESFTRNDSIPLNYTVKDLSDLDKCWYNVKNNTDTVISNTTLTNCENTTFDLSNKDDDYVVKVYSNDTYNNLGSDSQSFAIRVEKPSVNLHYPGNDNIFLDYDENIVFNFTTEDSDGIDTCKLYGNWTGSWKVNESFDVTSGETVNTTKNITDSVNNIWNVKCNDSLGNEGWALNNYTFSIDTINPNITIDYITTTKGSQTFQFNTTATDENLKECYYSIYDDNDTIDGSSSNVTFTCNKEIETTTSDYGTFELVTWVEDDANNKDKNTNTFVIEQLEPTDGGGGAPTTELNWTMTTTQGNDIYYWKMLPNQEREGGLLLENMEETNITLNFNCEGKLCSNLTFENKTLVLPVQKDIKVKNIFTLDLSNNIEEGTYVINLIATDQNSKTQTITLEVNVDKTNIISGIINKLSSNIGFLNIPISIIFILSIFIITFITSEIIPNKYTAGTFYSFLIGLIISFVIVYFI